MPITIGSNIASLRVQRFLDRSTSALSSLNEKLSSGQRINRASDDAAGLAIADRLQSDARLSSVAIRNVNDGLSALNIMESALQSQIDVMTRLEELATQSANGTLSNQQRSSLNREYQALIKESGRIGATAKFNNVNLLQSFGKDAQIVLQAGIDGKSSSTLSVSKIEGGPASGSLVQGDQMVEFSGAYTLEALINASNGSFLRNTLIDTRGRSHDVLTSMQVINGLAVGITFMKGNESNGAVSSSSDLWVVAGVGLADINGQMDDIDAVEVVTEIEDFYGVVFADDDASAATLGTMSSRLYGFAGGATATFSLNLKGLSITGPTADIDGGTYIGGPYNGTNTSVVDFTGIETQSLARSAMAVIEARQNQLSLAVGKIGATQSRLATASSVLSTQGTNLSAAHSRLRDVDIAEATADLTRQQILQQTAVSVLTQANQVPSLALDLLRSS